MAQGVEPEKRKVAPLAEMIYYGIKNSAVERLVIKFSQCELLNLNRSLEFSYFRLHLPI
jgi:hypothetical protein